MTPKRPYMRRFNFEFTLLTADPPVGGAGTVTALAIQGEGEVEVAV